MARWTEPTPDQLEGYHAWIASRPPNVRAIAKNFEPWSLYLLKSTGQRVTVYSFSHADPVTLTVQVEGKFNLVTFDRQVFGISPSDLEPCDLPAASELLGSMMTQNDVEANIDGLRVAMRPDLWVFDANGIAVRKMNG